MYDLILLTTLCIHFTSASLKDVCIHRTIQGLKPLLSIQASGELLYIPIQYSIIILAGFKYVVFSDCKS